MERVWAFIQTLSAFLRRYFPFAISIHYLSRSSRWRKMPTYVSHSSLRLEAGKLPPAGGIGGRGISPVSCQNVHFGDACGPAARGGRVPPRRRRGHFPAEQRIGMAAGGARGFEEAALIAPALSVAGGASDYSAPQVHPAG